MDLQTFNRLLEDTTVGLEWRAGQCAFPESFWQSMPDEVLDLPREFELESQNGTIERVAIAQTFVTTHAVLRAIETLEQESRGGDAHPDTRHVFVEGLEVVRGNAHRYRACWGS